MRPDRLYLLDIIDVHLAERDRERIPADVTRQAAVLHELTVIGEAAGRVSEALRRTYSGTPWAKVVSFRNVVAHEYFGLNQEIVWDTAIDLVPELRRQVAFVLTAEFPETPEARPAGLWLSTARQAF